MPGLLRQAGVILHDPTIHAGGGDHLPPWRVGVCLACYHCFDMVANDRCTHCDSRLIASFDTILTFWKDFRKEGAAS